jgi:hypothetical protein
MAIIVSAKDSLNAGPGLRIQIYSITLDTVYAATNGETCDMSSEFPNEVFGAKVIDDTKGFVVSYERAASGACSTGKLHARLRSGGTTGVKAQLAKVATGTNLASINFYLLAVGN